jgi:hypothetical protein
MGLLMGAIGFGAGCGSEATKPYPLCGEDGFICETSGFPFVSVVIAISDYCGGLVGACTLPLPPPAGATTANLTKQGGHVCLSGFVPTGGWTSLILPFSAVSDDNTTIVKSFDAARLGITQADFTIDSPLTGSIGVGAATTPMAPVDCPNASCYTNFKLATAPASGVAAAFAAPGPQVAPFANFYRAEGGNQPFVPNALEHISFSPSGPGDYAFCISDLKFRNAAGDEVRP